MLLKKVTRRGFMSLLGAGGAVLAAPAALGWFYPPTHGKEFPLKMSDAEWKKKLSPEAYTVLREHGTERAFSSPLNDEKRVGVFVCAGCGQKLYASAHKFDSGTGWPSFYQPIDDKAVGTSTDYKLVYPRTEVHCANCGGHLGHVFDDGPQPTGKRYCMNGAAMAFVAEERS